MMELLAKIWAHMDVAILRADRAQHKPENHQYGTNNHDDEHDKQTQDSDNESLNYEQTHLHAIGIAPAWFGELFPIETEPAAETNAETALETGYRWQDLGSFLENFAIDAEELWQQANKNILYSGYWSKETKAGKIYHLEAIALYVDDTALLLLNNSPNHYDEAQEILQRGRQMMLSYEKLGHQPYFDAVTGLYTMYGLTHLANERWLSHAQDDAPLLLMNVHIQNQQFLQEAAMNESALIETAQLIQRIFSPSDLAARVGSCHFKIILSDNDHAENAAAEIRSYIQARKQDAQLYPLELALEVLELSSQSHMREVLAG